jgi:hypothetical protein
MGPGARRAFTVVIPWLSVTQPRHGKVTEGAVHWFPVLPEHQVEEVIIFLTDATATALVSTWPGERGSGTKLVGRLELRNGSTVWVVNLRRAANPVEVATWTKAQVELSNTERSRQAATPDMRADLIGRREDDDSRYFVDLLLLHPTQGANPA